MKHCLKTVALFLFPLLMNAQQNIDSLKKAFSTASNDSLRYDLCINIYSYYEETNRDSALFYAEQQFLLAQKNNKKLAEVISLNNKAYQLTGLGRYAESLQYLLQAFKIAEDPANENEKTWPLFTSSLFKGNNRLLALAYTHHIFAILMWHTQNTEQEIFHFKEARRISENIGHTIRQMMSDMNLGRSYAMTGKLDSALFFEREAEQLVPKSGFKKYLGQIYNILGGIYYSKKDENTSGAYYYKGIEAAEEYNNMNSLSSNYFSLTKRYLTLRQKDSALKYAVQCLKVYQTLGGNLAGATLNKGTIYQNIYLSYKLNGQTDSAYKYQGLALNTIDSLSKIRIKNLADFQNVNLNEQLRLQNVEKEKEAYQNKVRTYFLLAGIAVLILLAIIFYRSNRQKHKANTVLEKTLTSLKSTQSQLIQSEKMASLGELTAGIAHEIQNPLNFVNNFSEVSNELIEELKMKNEQLKIEDEDVNELLKDIKQNLEKINHHGKRADAIVKGMLQHSRASTGKKELTDINALADEYLRLSYHGLRAKDKSFNAAFKTDFDETIGNINIIPQDIGRVILNLLTNAFYAVNEKKKANSDDYEPMVLVSTKKADDKVLVCIKDNGNGIPQKVLDKIFQPFFTTKPTGQGTGLGLSLSYDIIKAHGGEIKVKTKEGEGTEFVIVLSIKSTENKL